MTERTHLEQRMYDELVRHAVQREIFCPRTGEVLDVRTCVVLLDPDGDPIAVLSQAGWKAQSPVAIELLAARGITVDPGTVQDS